MIYVNMDPNMSNLLVICIVCVIPAGLQDNVSVWTREDVQERI